MKQIARKLCEVSGLFYCRQAVFYSPDSVNPHFYRG